MSDKMLPIERAARFHRGPEGRKEFEKWLADQPEEFQAEWEKQNDLHKDKFKKAWLQTKTAESRDRMRDRLLEQGYSRDEIRRQLRGPGRLPPAPKLAPETTKKVKVPWMGSNVTVEFTLKGDQVVHANIFPLKVAGDSRAPDKILKYVQKDRYDRKVPATGTMDRASVELAFRQPLVLGAAAKYVRSWLAGLETFLQEGKAASQEQADKLEAKAEAEEDQAQADRAKAEADSMKEAARKAPPKEHQFTSEDNPNPKGNDRDGDGKKNEEKPFKEAAGDDADVALKGYKPGDEVEIGADEIEFSELQDLESKTAAGGLYGYTKQTQGDVEAQIRKSQKKAAALARSVYEKDAQTAQFLQSHVKRSGSKSAKLLLKAMKGIGPRIASGSANVKYLDGLSASEKSAILNNLAKHYGETVAEMENEVRDPDAEALYEYIANDNGLRMKVYREMKRLRLASSNSERTAGGLYGYPTKTARLALNACTELRAYIGEVASDLHARRMARYAKITGFLKEHSKTARCAYSRMLLDCYPDYTEAKVASKTLLPIERAKAARFPEGKKMTVDEVSEVVGPEFKEMNEDPPESVVKLREKMEEAMMGDESMRLARNTLEQQLRSNIVMKAMKFLQNEPSFDVIAAISGSRREFDQWIDVFMREGQAGSRMAKDQNFPPEEIGKEEKGPLVDGEVTTDLKGHFTEGHDELLKKQESGELAGKKQAKEQSLSQKIKNLEEMIDGMDRWLASGADPLTADARNHAVRQLAALKKEQRAKKARVDNGVIDFEGKTYLVLEKKGGLAQKVAELEQTENGWRPVGGWGGYSVGTFQDD